MGDSMCGDHSRQPNGTSSYTDGVLDSCRRVHALVTGKGKIELDGHSLDISSVVVVARYVFRMTIPMRTYISTDRNTATVPKQQSQTTQESTSACKEASTF
jgi:riboflavin synthase alpha subunit